MGTLQFKNNASTTLSGSINNSQTTFTVVSGSGFPSITGTDYFYATMYEVSGATEINIEIVKVTGIVGNNWTVARGQDGTTARSRDGVTTCYVELRMTAAGAQLMLQKDNNLSDLANAATARTNLGLGSLATQDSSNVTITGGTISGVTFTTIDSTTSIADNVDSTKKVQFEVSGVTTGTTRVLTIPNASGTIALTTDLSAGYQPLDADLTAVAALAASGIIARTGAGTAAVRTITQPAAGITVTNGDGVAGNPTLALANDLGAVEALTGTGFVRRTGADTWSASALVDADIPGALTGKTYNGVSPSSLATGFSIAGGTTSKTLTVSNSLTLAGTDGTTITLPATSGTVPLNNQTFYIGTTAVQINRASATLTLTGTNIDGSAGSATTATTATKATNLVGGNTTTLLGAIGYQSNTDTTTLLSPNVSTTKQFLAQTGTGTNGAAPVWSTVSKSDVGLSSVENTALSTWAGSSSITTLGTIATGTWQGTAVGIAYGGTGAATKTAAFNALTPMTTLGDLEYHDGTNGVRLAGNTTTTRKFIRQTGNGTTSAAPAWDTLLDGDIPTALTGKTYNSLSLTAAATGFTVAGGTTSKTLTVSNTLTLAGTDSSTLNIGSGGTLGSAAFTASTAYAPAAGSSSIVTVGTITSGTWTGSTIGISYGGTGASSKAGGYNALTPITTLGDLVYGDGANSATRLAGNTSSSKRFLTQTGTGTVSAAPGWNAIVDGDLPTALTGKTYNGLTLTANATGFSVAGGTTAKTLTVNNNLNLSGTDGSTLNIGGGGTLGSAAYTASTAYAPAAGSTSVTTLGTVTSGTWNATAVAVAYGGTGATDAATARTNLGLAIGSNVQAYDGDLAAIAALVGTSGFLKKTAADTWTLDTGTYLTGNQSITLSGDASGTGATAIAVTLANSGVTAGTYNDSATAVRPFTVDAKGRITSIGAAVTVTPAFSSLTGKPTTLSGYGITDAQALDADLTAIAALAGTSGFLKKTAADTWSLDTNSYLTGNQSISLSGDATGSGTTSIAVTLANSGVTAGAYGGNNSIPSVTVDAKGRVTALSTVTPSGTWGISISGNAATASSATSASTASATSAAVTFNNGGAGAASGTTFNGSTAQTISYNTVGAPSTTGTNASGTWGINVTGNAGTVTNGVYTSGDQSISGIKTFSDIAFTDANFKAYVTSVYSIFLMDNAGAQADYIVYDRTNNSYSFTVNSSNRMAIDSAGNVTATANVTAYSDERLKKDWADLPDNFVEQLAQVKHGTYTRIDEGIRQIGVSAQSLQKVAPEGVLDGERLSVAYGNVALAAAVELAKKVVELEARLAALEA